MGSILYQTYYQTTRHHRRHVKIHVNRSSHNLQQLRQQEDNKQESKMVQIVNSDFWFQIVPLLARYLRYHRSAIISVFDATIRPVLMLQNSNNCEGSKLVDQFKSLKSV